MFRQDGDGSREAGTRILLVRSRDGRHWVLPKGHIDPGESPREAALREVREEAGAVCDIVAELGIDRYELPAEAVRARYFLMRLVDEVPAEEERELRWLAPGDAAAALDFPGSRALVEAAARRLGADL